MACLSDRLVCPVCGEPALRVKGNTSWRKPSGIQGAVLEQIGLSGHSWLGRHKKCQSCGAIVYSMEVSVGEELSEHLTCGRCGSRTHILGGIMLPSNHPWYELLEKKKIRKPYILRCRMCPECGMTTTTVEFTFSWGSPGKPSRGETLQGETLQRGNLQRGDPQE